LLRVAVFAASTILAGAGPASAQVISSVVARNVTNNSDVITWTTNLPSGSQVNYRTTTGHGASSPADLTAVTAHSVTLTWLTPNTLYNFDVVSVNTSVNSTTTPPTDLRPQPVRRSMQAPLTVSASFTVTVVASGYPTSAVASAAYTINNTAAATPTFSVAVSAGALSRYCRTERRPAEHCTGELTGPPSIMISPRRCWSKGQHIRLHLPWLTYRLAARMQSYAHNNTVNAVLTLLLVR
jgi:hypothetical protein